MPRPKKTPRAPAIKMTPGRGRATETDPKVSMGLSVLRSDREAIDKIAAVRKVTRTSLFEEWIDRILRTG